MPSFYVQTPSGRDFTFVLDKSEIAIGRELKNDLILDDPRVSRTHALARKTENAVVLRALDSGNGTFVNDFHIPPNPDFPLNDNDQIRLGSCRLTYHEVEGPQTITDEDSLGDALQKKTDELLAGAALEEFSPTQDIPVDVYRHELE